MGPRGRVRERVLESLRIGGIGDEAILLAGLPRLIVWSLHLELGLGPRWVLG